MRFTISFAAALVALTSPAAAHPTIASRASSSGCTVALVNTNSTPANAAEVILMKTMVKWNNSTDGSGFSSSYANWTHTMSAPFSVFFYADTNPKYSTIEGLEAVLEPWVGTWLISSTPEPASGNAGDYNITSVVCV